MSAKSLALNFSLSLSLGISLISMYSYSIAANAADNTTYPVALSRYDSLLLEQVVCLKPYGVPVAEIDARAFDKNAPKANFADIKCRPHSNLNQQALYYVAQCAYVDKQWSCSQAELETKLTLSQLNNRSLIIRPGSVDTKVAVNAIQSISSYGYFQAKSIDAALQSTCNLGLGEKPDLIEISCKNWSLTVSFWCPVTPTQKQCPRIIYMEQRQ